MQSNQQLSSFENSAASGNTPFNNLNYTLSNCKTVIFQSDQSKIFNTSILEGKVVLKQVKYPQIDKFMLERLNERFLPLVDVHCHHLAQYYRVEFTLSELLAWQSNLSEYVTLK